ncbi:hypothetical protein HK104_007306 [Borealophlyctis nickersoniae]|nr:hypothetical protein HK104_007306 [Borealophlyctis nickersoniae]
MSCETKNAKLVPIAVGCLQKLISHHAIPEGSVKIVIKSLSDMVGTSVELHLKVLQTVLPLLTNYVDVHGELLAEALLLCFRLQDTKSPIVNNTASATVRQLITFVFDKLAAEDAQSNTDLHEAGKSGSSSEKDAIMLFQDLCLLTGGETTTFLHLNGIPKTFGLELVESVLGHHSRLFKTHADLANLMKDRVCPLLIKSFSDKNEFPLTARLMRVVHVILKQFSDLLVRRVLLEPENSPLWQRVLVMEVFKSICADGDLLRSIYRCYDAKEHSTKVFQEMITAFGRIVVAEKSSLLVSAPLPIISDGSGTGPGAVTVVESYALNAAAATIKLQWYVGNIRQILRLRLAVYKEILPRSIDQLDKGEPPGIPDTYIIFLAVSCLNNMVESQSAFALPLLQTAASTPSEKKDDILLAIEMANISWANILAVLSFLVGASIDDDIFLSVVRAFQSFTSVVGLLGLTAPRDAFLSALCKVCLPNNLESKDSTSSAPGSRGGASVLNERNALCLRALLNIAQTLNPVLEDKAWHMILETLQISDGLMASGKMGRRDQSSVALLGDGKERLRAGSVSTPGPSAGGMDNHFVTLIMAARKLFESTATMEERNFMEFLRALCRLARESTMGTAVSTGAVAGGGKDSMKVAEEKSFAVAKLHDVALVNVGRLVASDNFQAWDLVVGELIGMAHSAGCSVSIRAQVCSTFSEVMIAAVQIADLKNPTIEMTVLEPLRKLALLDVPLSPGTAVPVPGSGPGVPADESRPTRGTWFIDVQKAGLETLNKALQTSGQNISTGWPLIFEVIRSVTNKKRSRIADSKPETSVEGESYLETVADSSSTGGKAASLVRVAFPCLQLICTDFLSLLVPSVLHKCIETLGGFGAQTDDLNISLTAIGLMWQISDFVLTKREELGKDAAGTGGSGSVGAVPETEKVGLLEMNSSDLDAESEGALSRSRSASLEVLKGPTTSKTMDTLWMLLLGHLSQLCSDSRPEVRNSANQTLFRTIGMNGRRLTLEAWDECIWHVLFPLLERVKVCSERADLTGKLNTAALAAAAAGGIPGSPSVSPTKGKGATIPSPSAVLPPPTSVHHSRNTIGKQWDETKVLTLSGVTKSLLDFLPVLVDLGEGFDRAWGLFLDYIKAWCLGGSPEVAMAAVKSLRTLVQYPKTVADGEVPGNVAKRLVELWRVAWEVWEGIGEGIVAGADENVGQTTPGGRMVVIGTGNNAPRLLHGFFTQDALTTYASIFPDLYEVIRPTFGLFELRRLLGVLSQLLVYHTNPQPGATASRIRADQLNDLETPTPFQSAVLEIVVDGKIDIEGMKGGPEVLVTTVAGFVKLPFVRGAHGTAGASGALTNGPNASTDAPKAFTYIALSKKSMQALVELFERYGKLRTLYSSGPFEATIEALGVPMRAKYDCPSPGTKDSTPLWRSAANTCMTVLRYGLTVLDEFVAELPQEVSNSIYSHLLDTLEGFLLPTSEPPSSLSPEELSADEAFDVSVLTTVETDIILHLGQAHVPESLILRLIEVIRKGSKLYSTQIESKGGPRANGNVPVLVGGIAGEAGSESVAKIKGGISSHALGSDVIPVVRERFGFSCLGTLFALVSDSKSDNAAVRLRLAEIVGPVLLEKCKEVLLGYTSDQPLYGRMPLPRIREEEMMYILRQLSEVNLRPNILVKALGEDKNRMYFAFPIEIALTFGVPLDQLMYVVADPLRSHILSGGSAHIFALYPTLCNVLCILAKGSGGVVGSGDGGGGGGGVAETGESQGDMGGAGVVESVRKCLGRIGKELGIENL